MGTGSMRVLPAPLTSLVVSSDNVEREGHWGFKFEFFIRIFILERH